MKHLKILIALIIILVVVTLLSSLLHNQTSAPQASSIEEVPWLKCYNAPNSLTISYPSDYEIFSTNILLYDSHLAEGRDGPVAGCQKDVVFLKDKLGNKISISSLSQAGMDLFRKEPIINSFQLPQGYRAALHSSTEDMFEDVKVPAYPLVLIYDKNIMLMGWGDVSGSDLEKIAKAIVFN